MGFGEELKGKALQKALVEWVRKQGMLFNLRLLPKEILLDLAKDEEFKYNGYGTRKFKPEANAIAKRLGDKAANDGIKEFLSKTSDDTLESIAKELELGKGDRIQNIIEKAEANGLEHLFSSFPIEELTQFAAGCKLKVQSKSREVLIDCLMNQTGFKKKKAETKKKDDTKVSKSKPEIKKGISLVDLRSWYYRDDLMNYCKEKGLKTGGNKKDLETRILKHLSGTDEKAKPKGKAKRKREYDPMKGVKASFPKGAPIKKKKKKEGDDVVETTTKKSTSDTKKDKKEPDTTKTDTKTDTKKDTKKTEAKPDAKKTDSKKPDPKKGSKTSDAKKD